MARSKIGGTRGWLRGRVANDLFQVTKDAEGKRIQLVRSVEESRINNNTMPQAMARMQMALCMGSLAQFKEIVDHSFEGIPYGQLSIAHFVHLNIPLIQQDCKNHWSDLFLWSYPEKGVSVPKPGSWVLAEGSLTMPDFITRHCTSVYGYNSGVQLDFNVANLTKAMMKEKLGLADNDYITHLAFAESTIERFNKLVYLRLYLNPNFADSTVITTDNYRDVFTYASNANFRSTFDASTGTFWFYFDRSDIQNCDAFPVDCNIISRWDGRTWCRNNARFLPTPNYEDYTTNWASPHSRFQSWFPEYDPDASDEYPLPTDDWVDLGLPSGTLWRKFNVGATVPQSAGLFFSWGNIQGHHWNGSTFDDGYNFNQANYSLSPGSQLTGDLDNAHDAAREYLGEHWKIPTSEQMNELIENCTKSIYNFGVRKCLVLISNSNRENLILPIVGVAVNQQLLNVDAISYYFTTKYNDTDRCTSLIVNENLTVRLQATFKRYGSFIRPVYIP